MKYLILTSIFEPTKALKEFSEYFSKKYKIIVVADVKTPLNWNLKGVDFLSIQDQKKLNMKLTRILPFNSYSRKNIGYILAIKNGAELIAETDDDNIPYKNWGLVFPKNILFIKGYGFVNIYSYFSKEKVWPRGYPLDEILKKNRVKSYVLTPEEFQKKYKSIGIIQYLADIEPDVDAIYRLTIKKNIKFKKKLGLILDRNLYTPFNSQNTFFIKKELFPLLYLPTYCSIRATDIYRGYIAQFIAHSLGYNLMIGPATVYQERNFHDYLKDFELEIPVYLNVKKIVKILENVKFRDENVFERLKIVYTELVLNKIVNKDEIKILNAWITDIKNT